MSYGFPAPPFPHSREGKLALLRVKVQKCIVTFSSLGTGTIMQWPSLFVLHFLFHNQIHFYQWLMWFHFSLAFIFCALHLSIALGARRKHTAEVDSVVSGVWKGWPWNVLCLFSAMGANPN